MLFRSLALDDSLAEAHYLLGVCLREQRRPQDGLRELRRAVALNPGLVPAREALAEVFRAAGRRREHIEQLEAIAALEPDEPRRLISIADAYAKSGRADTALATIDRGGWGERTIECGSGGAKIFGDLHPIGHRGYRQTLGRNLFPRGSLAVVHR